GGGGGGGGAEGNARGRPQGGGDDGGGEVALVAILVRGGPGAGLVAVDQARVGLEAGEPAGVGGAGGDVAKDGGQGRPGPPGRRIERVVAIALAIRDPAEAAAVRHRDRHRVAARADHLADRGFCRDGRGG